MPFESWDIDNLDPGDWSGVVEVIGDLAKAVRDLQTSLLILEAEVADLSTAASGGDD